MRDGTTNWVDLRTNMQLDAYYRGTYDSELIGLIRSLLTGPNPVFLDVGANIGSYTVAIAMAMRSRGQTGHVIAFEPFEGNYTRLLENRVFNSPEECRAGKGKGDDSPRSASPSKSRTPI